MQKIDVLLVMAYYLGNLSAIGAGSEVGEPMATKKCPFCAEEIQEEAIFCKHCKRDLKVENPTTEKKTTEISESVRN